MKNGATYHRGRSGAYQPPRSGKSAQASSEVHGRVQVSAISQGHIGRSKTIHTGGVGADHFLKLQFRPKYLGETNNSYNVSGFYNSLALLCDFYKIQPTIETKHLPYPYSIKLLEYDLNKQLPSGQHIRLGSDHFEGVDYIDTGMTFYFIEVEPVLMLHKVYPDTAKLILFIFSYLLDIGIQYFTDDCETYMAGQYSWIREWCLEAFEDPSKDPEEAEEEMKDYYEHMQMGQDTYDLLEPTKNYRTFLNQFSPSDEVGQYCFDIALKFCDFMEQNPYTTMDDIAFISADQAEQYNDEDFMSAIRPEQYLSFISSLDPSSIYSAIEDTINAEIQEAVIKYEPGMIHRFIENEDYDSDLNFARELFNLIDELATVLNQLRNHFKPCTNQKQH